MSSKSHYITTERPHDIHILRDLASLETSCILPQNMAGLETNTWHSVPLPVHV